MKLAAPNCPECGELASGSVELVAGVAWFTLADDGTFEQWDGETKMFWESSLNEEQYNQRDGWRLHCGNPACNRVEWVSPLEGTEEEGP